MPGWTEQVKPERYRSLLWHWIGCESGKPWSGVVYDIMRRAKHSYHFAVRSCKKRSLKLRNRKLLLTWRKVRIPGRKLKRLFLPVKLYLTQLVKRTVLKIYLNCFLKSIARYTTVFRLMRTNWTLSRDVIDSNITEQIYITPDIIRICIGKLKAGKDDGNIGFKCDHIINGIHRLYVLLSLLYNLMFYHGNTPADLLKSTIFSIPKDNKASLSGSDNYRGISLFNSLSKLFDHNIVIK